MSTHENGFDLAKAPKVSDIEDQGTVVHIRDIQGEAMHFGDGLPVTVTIAGSYSSRYRRALNAQTTRMLGRRTQKMTGELAQENRVALISRCVISWEGFTSNGTPIPCTPENVLNVLEVAPWIREQLESAMEDHESFFKNSSTS